MSEVENTRLDQMAGLIREYGDLIVILTRYKRGEMSAELALHEMHEMITKGKN